MTGVRGVGLSRTHLTLDGAPLIDPRNPEVSERRGIGPHDMTGVSRYWDRPHTQMTKQAVKKVQKRRKRTRGGKLARPGVALHHITLSPLADAFIPSRRESQVKLRTIKAHKSKLESTERSDPTVGQS